MLFNFAPKNLIDLVNDKRVDCEASTVSNVNTHAISQRINSRENISSKDLFGEKEKKIQTNQKKTRKRTEKNAKK